MTVLMAALQLASSSSAALRDQYYNMLAREAAEAGAVMMGECLKQGYFDTTKTVRPETDCEAVSRGALPVIYESGNLRTTFEGRYEMVGGNRATSVVGMSQLRRPGGGSVYKEYKYTARQHATQEEDRAATRASHRWWYLGRNAKIDFGIDNSVQPHANATAGPAGGVDKAEGVTTISNRRGELLFYSNGLSLWDRDGYEVKNGSGLKGSYTATQAVASFPIGGEERYYVIVTNSANNTDILGKNGEQGHLYYSVLDILGNHGRGEILENAKNIRMGGNGVYSSEALNAVPMPDGQGYWVYTYTPTPENNILWGFRFREKSKSNMTEYRKNPVRHGENGDVIGAYNVTAKDYHLRARICQRTNRNAITRDYHTPTAFGTINFNNDYSRMAVMMGGTNCAPKINGNTPGGLYYSNDGTVHVLNINRETGYLTRYTSFYAGTLYGPPDTDGYVFMGYSADFSPSGRYVYISTIYPARVRRFDIQNPDQNIVHQSQRFVANSGCSDYAGSGIRGTKCSITSNGLVGRGPEGGGQVLRGPNGKMYVADRGTQWVSVINNPDAPTPAGTTQGNSIAETVDWRYGGDGGNGTIRLPAGSYSYYGLPQMVTLYSPRLIQY